MHNSHPICIFFHGLYANMWDFIPLYLIQTTAAMERDGIQIVVIKNEAGHEGTHRKKDPQAGISTEGDNSHLPHVESVVTSDCIRSHCRWFEIMYFKLSYTSLTKLVSLFAGEQPCPKVDMVYGKEWSQSLWRDRDAVKEDSAGPSVTHRQVSSL
jgi:hypothetical protein